jgi:ADP-dependent NAD(P)H-hydrate dehydratase / NAD(P)H-hydrate epimerase
MKDLRFPRRPRDAHKGKMGRLAIIAGSSRYAGAAVFCAEGARRAGAGLVDVASAALLDLRGAGLAPEVMTRALPGTPDGRIGPAARRKIDAVLAEADACVVGPGLGRSSWLRTLLSATLRPFRGPVLFDADALNAFAGEPEALAELGGRRVLTPHPGEAARLLARELPRGLSGEASLANRREMARELAERARALIVLKGSPSLVSSFRPGGDEAESSLESCEVGGPILARGGSGDVLSGLIGGLLARGIAPLTASRGGVLCHGLAAQTLAARDGEAVLDMRELAREAGLEIGKREGA